MIFQPSFQAQPTSYGRLLSQAPPIGSLVRVTAPARVDLGGGWTDTPPICYDLGGKCVGAAIALDGKVQRFHTFSFFQIQLMIFNIFRDLSAAT